MAARCNSHPRSRYIRDSGRFFVGAVVGMLLASRRGTMVTAVTKGRMWTYVRKCGNFGNSSDILQ